MRVRIVATLAAVSLAAAPVLAQSPADRALPSTPSISQSARRAASDITATQISQSGTVSSENPYFLPGILTLAAGGLITLYGLVHESGVDCSTSASNISCNTTHSTGVIVAGLAVVGTGGYLLYRGNQQKHRPQILAGPGGILVRQRITWK